MKSLPQILSYAIFPCVFHKNATNVSSFAKKNLRLPFPVFALLFEIVDGFFTPSGAPAAWTIAGVLCYLFFVELVA